MATNTRTLRRGSRWLAVALLVLLTGLALPATALTLTPTDRGWYDSTGVHNATSENSFTGSFGGTDYRSFYAFDVSATGSPWLYAPLEFELELFYNGDATESVELFAVTSSAASVTAGSTAGAAGLAIYNDLGSGVSYGTATFTASDVGVIVNLLLNAAGIADINAARGGQFLFGLVHTTPNGGDQGLRFGTNASWDGGSTAGAEVSEPTVSMLVLAGFAAGLFVYRRREHEPTSA